VHADACFWRVRYAGVHGQWMGYCGEQDRGRFVPVWFQRGGDRVYGGFMWIDRRLQQRDMCAKHVKYVRLQLYRTSLW